jgi:hypothetical protein
MAQRQGKNGTRLRKLASDDYPFDVSHRTTDSHSPKNAFRLWQKACWTKNHPGSCGERSIAAGTKKVLAKPEMFSAPVFERVHPSMAPMFEQG